MQERGAVVHPARIIKAYIVFNQRIIWLVYYLVPGNFGPNQSNGTIQAQEVGKGATAVAVAAIDVLG